MEVHTDAKYLLIAIVLTFLSYGKYCRFSVKEVSKTITRCNNVIHFHDTSSSIRKASNDGTPNPSAKIHRGNHLNQS